MKIVLGILHLTLAKRDQGVRLVIGVRIDVPVRRPGPPDLDVLVEELELVQQGPLAAVDPVLHYPPLDGEPAAEVRHPFFALLHVHLAQSAQLSPGLLLLGLELVVRVAFVVQHRHPAVVFAQFLIFLVLLQSEGFRLRKVIVVGINIFDNVQRFIVHRIVGQWLLLLLWLLGLLLRWLLLILRRLLLLQAAWMVAISHCLLLALLLHLMWRWLMVLWRLQLLIVMHLLLRMHAILPRIRFW